MTLCIWPHEYTSVLSKRIAECLPASATKSIVLLHFYGKRMHPKERLMKYGIFDDCHIQMEIIYQSPEGNPEDEPINT